jgi:hypothetical protein
MFRSKDDESEDDCPSTLHPIGTDLLQTGLARWLVTPQYAQIFCRHLEESPNSRRPSTLAFNMSVICNRHIDHPGRPMEHKQQL